MANKGCNNCTHYKIGELRIWTENIPSKCLLGKDEEFNSWWLENGRKKNIDEITDMACFQETKFGEFCDKLGIILDEIRNVVNKNHS